jgi:hypothetical protein
LFFNNSRNIRCCRIKNRIFRIKLIKQNIVTSLKTLGTSSAKTVTAQLKKDGLIGGAATADPTASEKERRFVEIRP